MVLLAGLAGLPLSGCGMIKKLPARMMSSTFEGLSDAIAGQPDVRMVQDALPAYLLLMDGLLISAPDDPALLRTAARSYSSYASAFVPEEEPERLVHLYTRAREYSLRLLHQTRPKIAAALRGTSRDFDAILPGIGKDDVPDLFLAGSCLAGWISANSGSAAAIAEQPKLVALMERVLELDEGHFYGGPHLFFGIYYGVKPEAFGGNPELSRVHFERALEFSGEQFLMTRVLYAQYYARQVLDQQLYESLLQQVLDAPVENYPDSRLMNEVARVKARTLLELSPEYF
jgi:hypothetical protein